jgi:hypothetical protein
LGNIYKFITVYRPVDILEYSRKITIENNINVKFHLWLKALSEIDSHSRLDTSRMNAYLEVALQKHPVFTKLIDGNYMSDRRSMSIDRRVRAVHLPISDDSHLLIALETRDENEMIHYVDCKGRCKVLPPYTFPLVSLKKSIDFSQNEEIMDSISKGRFFYDSSLSPREMTPDVITTSFNRFTEFIDYARE